MAVFTTALVATALGVAETSFAASVSAFALNAAVGIGVSMLAKKLSEPKQQQQTNGVQGTLQAGGDIARSILFGRRCTAGSLVYANTWGEAGKTPNAYITYVIALSDYPVADLTAFWVNGEPVTIDTENTSYGDWGFPVKEYADDGNNSLWVKWYDGTQTEADPFLVNTVSTSTRPYQSTRVGTGVAYAVVTAQANDELFTGFPTFRFEMQGAKLYDVSKDSSAGGIGPQRWETPATWGGDGDDLPAVQLYNILRGIRFGGDWLYGLQSLTAAQLPAADWIERITRCRAQINGPSGMEPTYLTSLEISVDTEIATTVESILTGCQGRLIEAGGIYKTRIGVFGSPVFEFSDDDILSTEEQTFEPFFGLADTVNGVSATYPEPKESWNTKTPKPLYNADYEAEDGGRRLMTDIQMDMVYRSSQVQRIMKSALAEARRARRHTITLPPGAWVLEPGDVVGWVSNRNGYDNKRFRVDGYTDHANLDVMLSLTEVDPSDYDWDQVHDYTPPVFAPIGPILPPEQPMTGWTVEAATIADNTNAPRRPAIRISCAADLKDVMQVWVQVRNKETGDVVFDSNSSPYAPPYAWLLSGNWCLPATDYEARGKYVPYSSRKTGFSAWLDVTTLDTRLSFVDLAADIVESLQTLKDWIAEDLPTSIADNAQSILQETQDRITAISQETEERVDSAFEAASRYRALADELAAVRDYAANIDYGQYQQKEELRQELKVQIDTSIASFIDQVTAAAGNNAAIVARLTVLEANTSNLQAEITAVDLAQSSNYQALSDRMALLSAGTDNQFDPAKLWVFDTSVEGWTGNGAPTVANGYLRPANHATDPYVVSPTALAINANISRQVRARIRKTGNPSWEGYAWWMTSADSTWDASRRLSIAAPNYDLNGFALLTWDLAWTSTIDQIRLDLSTAQTATDYFEIDWIAIGSPSPGASRSDLAIEQQARASGDSANAQQITLLQAHLNDVNGDVSAVATAVNTLEGSVTQLGDDVTSQGQAVTSLQQDVAGKASADALNQLSAEVDALGGGGIVSNGLAITALRNSLLPLASEMLDQDFANFLGDMQGKKLTAEASQTLTTRIEQTESSIDILAQAVTLVQATLPGKADASALNALTSRVTATESGVTSLSSSITSLQNGLTGKADATALQSLTNTVMQQGNTIGSQGTAITNLQNSLAGKASASALNTLSSTVDQQGDQITAQAQSLTSLTTSVNGITASARLKAEVLSGPSGYARIGFSAAAASGGATQSAGLYIDVPTNGSPPQVIVEANRFGVVSGGGAKANVFAVDSDGVYIDTGYIRSISTDKITFKDGSVQTTALAKFAASQIFTAATATAYTPGSSYENTLQLDDVPRDVGNGLLVFADLRAQITPGYEGQTLAVELWDLSNNALAQTSITITTAGVAVTAYLHTLVQATGNLHFKLIVKGVTGDATKFIIGRRTISAVLLNKSV